MKDFLKFLGDFTYPILRLMSIMALPILLINCQGGTGDTDPAVHEIMYPEVHEKKIVKVFKDANGDVHQYVYKPETGYYRHMINGKLKELQTEGYFLSRKKQEEFDGYDCVHIPDTSYR